MELVWRFVMRKIMSVLVVSLTIIISVFCNSTYSLAATDSVSDTTELKNVEQIRQTVTTYPNVKSTYLYNSKGEQLQNVALSANTNLAINETATINNEQYYQVATNQWVSSKDVYTYKMSLLTIRTKDNDFTSLIDAHGSSVANRALSANSNWKIDKVVEINNKKYYRIAVNEFVDAKKVVVVK